MFKNSSFNQSNFAILFSFCLIFSDLISQPEIQSGPMNGYADMREAMVWVQMQEPCIVELEYWIDTVPEQRFRSVAAPVTEDNALCAHLVANQVEPGLRYEYDIFANGSNVTSNRELYFKTQALWQWRTDPPEFTFALGSCAYVNQEAYDRPGRPYGGGYEIFEHIADDEPDLMLWLGDNVYLRESDWFTRTGIQARYTHTRSLPEMQRLLSSTSHYAIWDDHDYGPNNSNRSFPYKDLTLEVFKQFWANPAYGNDEIGAMTTAFQYADCHFFLLDNRWNRTDPNLKTIEEQVFGESQIDWLIENLSYSRAPFKFILAGGQVLNTDKIYETYANYEAEREELLNRIVEEGIQGVIFLTGDRHHTELSKFEKDGIVIYDLTVSPFTSSAHTGAESEKNNLRIDNTLLMKRNYGLISVSGKRRERKLKIEIKDTQGNLEWSRTIE